MDVVCRICDKKFSNYAYLSRHIKKHNITVKKYYDTYLATENNECKNCKKETPFLSLKKGYQKYCSLKCGMSSVETKQKRISTCLKKFGTLNPLQCEDVKTKIKETCLKKYGSTNVFGNDKIILKIKKTNIRKFGVENPSQSDIIKEKKKQTCLKNFGVNYSMQSKEAKEKSKKTCLSKYGTEFSSQSEIVKEKNRQTCLKKYGTTSPLNSNIIKEKIRKIFLKKYNVDNPFKSKEIISKIKNVSLEKYYNRLLNSDRLRGIVSPNFDLNEFEKNHFTKKMTWICTKCGNVFEDNLDNGKIPRCLICFPIHCGISNLEKELYNFMESLEIEIEKNNRSIISPKELDIYISSKKLAIEFNGLYWHSELSGGKDKYYHLNKTKDCLDKNIKLIHIFEDEWLNKQEIVKSIIRSKLNLITNKIPARKCNVTIIPREQVFNFLDSNHLQGYINGSHLGLYYNNELVSVLTYGKPRFNKKYEFEILRFCNKLDTVVVGGLSKLLSKINSKPIITYVDRRFGTGDSYKYSGFRLLGSTIPAYYYTKNYKYRENRLQFQKHLLESKLESFDPSLTEWQNMQLNGYDRIWDCGNLVYEYS